MRLTERLCVCVHIACVRACCYHRFSDPARSNVLSSDCTKAAPIVVVTGFVAATLEGTPTTLKRSGSDYSATIFAR